MKQEETKLDYLIWKKKYEMSELIVRKTCENVLNQLCVLFLCICQEY
jgi:hypothetical protein